MIAKQIHEIKRTVKNLPIGYKTSITVPNNFPDTYRRVIEYTIARCSDTYVNTDASVSEWGILLSERFSEFDGDTTTVTVVNPYDRIGFVNFAKRAMTEIVLVAENEKEVSIGLDVLLKLVKLNG